MGVSPQKKAVLERVWLFSSLAEPPKSDKWALAHLSLLLGGLIKVDNFNCIGYNTVKFSTLFFGNRKINGKRKGSGDMQTTTSIHWNKGEIAKAHNEREESLCRNESHIDLKNEHGYSYHEVLVRTDLREAYQDIFGDALDSYNAKQKRADRRKSIDDYMQSIVDDTRGKRQTKKVNGKRVVDEDARQGKQLSYEFTVKVGNTERERDKNGRVKYDSNDHHIRTQELPRELQNIILKEYARTFQQNNPNLILVNADLHGDEGFYNRKGVWEYSEDHLHCEVVPVASGFKTGLSVQNSMNKAMAQMGFDTPECYQEWAKKEQERLEEITKAKYVEYCQAHPNFYSKKGDLEIIHPVTDRTKEGGKSKEQLASEQELDEAIHEAESIKRTFLKGMEQVREKEKELVQREKDVERSRENVNDMHEIVLHDREVNQRRKARLDEREKKLDTRENDLDTRENDLNAREGSLAFIEENALKIQNTALQMQKKQEEKEKEFQVREDALQAQEEVMREREDLCTKQEKWYGQQQKQHTETVAKRMQQLRSLSGYPTEEKDRDYGPKF